jgi:hypothetical protein
MPGQLVLIPHSRLQKNRSHSGGGGVQVPPTQVSSPEQSLSLQHPLAHTHCAPLFIQPAPQVKSQVPAAVQVLVPLAGAAQGAQLAEVKQPVCVVFPAQTPPQKCCPCGHGALPPAPLPPGPLASPPVAPAPPVAPVLELELAPPSEPVDPLPPPPT